ncbi:UxaA family hydrolase, partial [Enterococcus faecalis]|uniref:UxaA family hydrolase n=1 Tax=Enterococcus faecalis TaxID=1351 RepID=UPI0034E3861E
MSLTIRLHVDDDVLIARQQLIAGAVLSDEQVRVLGLVPPGHKIAIRDIAVGAPVRRYGQIIGFASQAIRCGEHVHVHNLAMGVFERGAADMACADARPTVGVDHAATFRGIVRPNGSVATRNYIGVLTSVNCSATVARAIADRFRRDIHPQELDGFPNIDGVVALTHG